MSMVEAELDYVLRWDVTIDKGEPLSVSIAQGLQAKAAGNLADIIDNGKVLKMRFHASTTV